MINYEDFSKMDIRIGTIILAEKIKEADRLVRIMLDVGEEKDRQIVSGIAEFFPDTGVLVGKQVPVLVNLEMKKIMGYESYGMILYIVGEGFLKTLVPSGEVPPGTQVK